MQTLSIVQVTIAQTQYNKNKIINAPMDATTRMKIDSPM